MKLNDTDKKRVLLLYLAAALIPMVLIAIALYVFHALPFGKMTILLRDSNIQYVDFSAYWKSVLVGENDLFYSFSKTMGGDMVSLAAYYLLSPFNILFIFSTPRSAPLIFTVLILLKTALCSVTFFYAAGKRFGIKPLNLAFSVSYALAAYTTMYGWSLMWLDGVIVLPLLGLGIHRIVKGKSAKLYTVVLAYALLTEFYIGYMLCIASVLFFLAEFVLHEADRKEKGKLLGKYAFSSGVGGLSAAFIWLPTFLALQGERAKKTGVFTFEPNFSILDFASKYVIGASSYDEFTMLGLPYIFSGMLTLLLVLLFFTRKDIARKVRLVVLAVLAVLYLSFLFPALNVVWHGFSPNIGFNYRYAFVFSYVLIMVAQYTLSSERRPRVGWVLAAAALVIGVLLLVWHENYWHNSVKAILFSIAVVCGFAGCFLLGRSKPRLAALLLLILSIGEMGTNYYVCIGRVIRAPQTLYTEGYYDFVDTTGAAVDYVKQYDDSFYRMEKDYRRDQNDAMLLQYNGLSHFSSTEDIAVARFMRTVGFHNYQDIWAYYGMGSTAGMDALLGVKYLLSQEDMTALKNYEQIHQVEEIGIYRNPYVLPLAVYADSQVTTAVLEQGDPFAAQTVMWQSLTGTDAVPLQQLTDYTVTLENLSVSANADGSCTYTRIDPAAPAAIRYELPAQTADNVYFYATAPDRQNAQISINEGEPQPYFDSYNWQIRNLGSYENGDTVMVELLPLFDQFTVDKVYFYYEDMAVLEDLTAQVTAQPTQIVKQTSSCVTGTITADKDGILLFTIPYDKGWTLYLDGEEVATQAVWDIFLATEVTAGTHTFEMRYIPVGMIPGGVISAAAVLSALGWMLIKRKMRSKQHPAA